MHVKLLQDHFNMQEICDKAVEIDPSSLQYVPDWFVTKECVQMWYDYNEHCDDDDDDDDDDDEENFLSGTKVIKNESFKKPQ